MMQRPSKSLAILLTLFMILNISGCAIQKRETKRSKNQNQISITGIYQIEIASIIRKKWAYQPSGNTNKKDNICGSVIFKVLPDGTIKDIVFTERTGSKSLDTSILSAIEQSSPVTPHPEGLSVPFLSMGLRFSLEGAL